VKACFHKRKKKKATFREAEWSALGKANAKWIILNHPDGTTTDIDAQVIAWDRGLKGDLSKKKTSN